MGVVSKLRNAFRTMAGKLSRAFEILGAASRFQLIKCSQGIKFPIHHRESSKSNKSVTLFQLYRDRQRIVPLFRTGGLQL
jgi:hypothetical protein